MKNVRRAVQRLLSLPPQDAVVVGIDDDEVAVGRQRDAVGTIQRAGERIGGKTGIGPSSADETVDLSRFRIVAADHVIFRVSDQHGTVTVQTEVFRTVERGGFPRTAIAGVASLSCANDGFDPAL